jgi:hypothetical protein
VEGAVAAVGMAAEAVSTVVAAFMAVVASMVEAASVVAVLPGEVAEPISPEGAMAVVGEADMDRA